MKTSPVNDFYTSSTGFDRKIGNDQVSDVYGGRRFNPRPGKISTSAIQINVTKESTAGDILHNLAIYFNGYGTIFRVAFSYQRKSPSSAVGKKRKLIRMHQAIRDQ